MRDAAARTRADARLRKRDERERRRAAGYVQLQVWAHKADAAKVRRYAVSLYEERQP